MADAPSDDDDQFEPGSAKLIPSARGRAIPVERIRPARLAGRFYPADPVALKETVRALLPVPRPSGPRALGLVVPHGPLAFIGRVAAAAIGGAVLEETMILLSPNHAARGPRAAVVAEGGFAIPGKVIPIDERVAESVRALAGLSEAPEVFAEDHAIESLLPMLVAAQPRLSIVPIALHSLTAHMAMRIGSALADAVTGHGGGITVVATTDLAHYVGVHDLDRLCAPILEHAAQLDEEALLASLAARSGELGPVVEICGAGALLVAVHALRLLGAAQGTITARGRSGEVAGESGLEVGYGSIVYASASSAR
jgi:AmmeMemoRadiSam system protein B